MERHVAFRTGRRLVAAGLMFTLFALPVGVAFGAEPEESGPVDGRTQDAITIADGPGNGTDGPSSPARNPKPDGADPAGIDRA
jgi:hypothetical protein